MTKTNLLVNSVLYVWSACIAVLVRLRGLRKSMETRLLRRRLAVCAVGCRLAGDVIKVCKIRITQNEFYCCVRKNTDCLAQSSD